MVGVSCREPADIPHAALQCPWSTGHVSQHAWQCGHTTIALFNVFVGPQSTSSSGEGLAHAGMMRDWRGCLLCHQLAGAALVWTTLPSSLHRRLSL